MPSSSSSSSSSSPAFSSSAALPPRSCSSSASPVHSRSSSSPRRPPRAQVTTVSDAQLAALASSPGVVVLKCFAKYCPGCRGVEPKFRKIAAAYERQSDQQGTNAASVAFCQIDYARYEHFCKDQLGVQSLPFFGIWRDGQYVGGEPMGWKSVGKKLVDRIESVLAEETAVITTTTKS